MGDKKILNKNYILWILFLLIALGLASCQADSEMTPGVVDTQPSSQPMPTSPGDTPIIQAQTPDSPDLPTPGKSAPDPAAIQAAWQSSSHADTFVLDASGQNNSCARCHAPINWMPAMEDLPESCFACKFELEPPPATISEVDWTNVPCKICHRVDKKDNIPPEIAWLEIAPLGEYAEVATASELCFKCHTAVDLPLHPVIEVAGAHAGYECTQCHSPHDTQASCDTAGCHKPSTSPIPGHDADHQAVSCVACHDGGSMEVGLNQDTAQWVTFAPGAADAGIDSFPFTSHNVIRDAPCERCHFPDNPWGLTGNVEKP
jgi:hypothetical protein